MMPAAMMAAESTPPAKAAGVTTVATAAVADMMPAVSAAATVGRSAIACAVAAVPAVEWTV